MFENLNTNIGYKSGLGNLSHKLVASFESITSSYKTMTMMKIDKLPLDPKSLSCYESEF